MSWLKELHFTLHGACTHLDRLAENIQGPHCWGVEACLSAGVTNICYFSLNNITSRACTQFCGYLWNQRQTKTLLPPVALCFWQRVSREAKRRKGGLKRYSTSTREAGSRIQASTKLSKRENKNKKSRLQRDNLLSPELSVCVYSPS